jgi:hypothetical protein
MQKAIAEILLNGNVQHTVVRAVTAAEVPLLREVHGSDAVVNGQAMVVTKRTQAAEIARLKDEYGAQVFSKVYAGTFPKLPSTFDEVGLEIQKSETKPAKKAAAAE